MNKLSVANIEFAVAEAVLDAYVAATGLCWGFRIQSEYGQSPYNHWAPKLESEVVLTTTERLGSYNDFGPVEISWGPPNDNSLVPSAYLYIFEHTPVYDSKVRLFRDQNGFKVQVHATADIVTDCEEISGPTTVIAQSSLDFMGILCGRCSEQESLDLVGQYMDPECLIFERDNYNVGILRPKSFA
ncbi:MAG: hypothetical protein AAGI88_13770 [Pseudomonadota bacterium]